MKLLLRQMRLYFVTLCTLLVVCVAIPVHAAQENNARSDVKRPAGVQSFAPAPGISLERATAIARKHTGGRVLSATPKQRSSGTEYRVRMLVDGERVVTVTVDARGKIKNKK
jgi:uncharacterized membrane protein YkoI